MSEDKLADFLRTGKDWARTRTSIPGVFVLKLPPYKASPARLVAELNPVDEAGNPKKRRGLILRSGSELGEFKEIFQDEKLPKLLGMIDKVNLEVKAGRVGKGEEEVIEL